MVERLLSPSLDVQRDELRGLDHGAWLPLMHMYPAADIPVVQLSIPWTNDPERMVHFGQALAPLRDEGILLLGSGNLVHNLGRVDWSGGPSPSWAVDFDGWLGGVLLDGDRERLQAYRSHPLAAISHPTHEHFAPILAVAGAAGAGETVSFPLEGFELGSVSRRVVRFG